MEEIKGLERCLLWYSARDPDSTTFQAIHEHDEARIPSLWKCKYDCLEGIKDCTNYRPLSKYPQSTIYIKVLADHFALKHLNESEATQLKRIEDYLK